MTKVITVANKKPEQPYYCWDAFHESLNRFGCTPTVLGFDQPWGGLMTKPRRLRDWLKDNCDGSPIIVCDAWDVVFSACPGDIIAEFRRSRGLSLIIWNAEKTLFPDATMNFPEVGTPYRYLNSGFSVGYDHAYRRLLDEMDLDSIQDDHSDGDRRVEPNDQLFFQLAYLNNSVPMSLDTKAEICQTLHAVTEEELDLSGDRIQNRITGSFPMAFHFNGMKQLWRDKILTKLGLPLRGLSYL